MQKHRRICSVIVHILVILIGAVVFISCSPKDGEGGGSKNADHVTVKNKGSDTMVNLAQAWAEMYTGVTTIGIRRSIGGRFRDRCRRTHQWDCGHRQL